MLYCVAGASMFSNSASIYPGQGIADCSSLASVTSVFNCYIKLNFTDEIVRAGAFRTVGIGRREQYVLLRDMTEAQAAFAVNARPQIYGLPVSLCPAMACKALLVTVTFQFVEV